MYILLDGEDRKQDSSSYTYSSSYWSKTDQLQQGLLDKKSNK